MTTRAQPWTPPSGYDVKVLRTGNWWDAVRASALVGEHALKLLGDESGAVIQDKHGPMYWLVQPGAADGWNLPQVHVLSASTAEASFIGVPPAHWRNRPGTYWRVPVGPDCYLTDALLLHKVLIQAATATRGARCDHP